MSGLDPHFTDDVIKLMRFWLARLDASRRAVVVHRRLLDAAEAAQARALDELSKLCTLAANGERLLRDEQKPEPRPPCQ